MMITIDPAELTVAASTLHSCAVESADVGTQLAGCADCAMPVALQSVVEQLVAGADRTLDEIAARLDGLARDLTRRAAVAVDDSLVTASISGMSTVSALYPPTAALGGWDAASDVTVVAPDGSPVDTSTWLNGMSVVGGTDAGWTDLTAGWMDGMSVVGGTDPGWTDLTGTWMDGMDGGSSVASFGASADTSGWINEILGGASTVGAPTGPAPAASTNAATNIALMNITRFDGELSAVTLAPSRGDLSDRAGYPLSDGEIQLISPYTLGIQHPSIFEGTGLPDLSIPTSRIL